MSQNLSAKQMEIIDQPVEFIKNYFAQLSQDQVLNALTGDNSQNFTDQFEQLLGIEGSIELRNTGIPRLNDCKSAEEIMKLHHKLVRFDCMIQDQYDEEFFISYLKPKEGGEQSNSPSKPAPVAKENGLVYKYYSELSEQDLKKYDFQPSMSGGENFMTERGSVLGISIPNLNNWVETIMKDGHPSAQDKGSSQVSAIVKLYDKNTNAFKLNEQITFIGVLEFKPPTANQIDSNQPKDEDIFAGGIPNEDKVPQIHAICCRKMAVLQCPELLRYCKVDKDLLREQLNADPNADSQMEGDYIRELQEQLQSAQKKLLAIFKLIFKGDELQSCYLLYNLLSKVEQRTPEGVAMGQFNINISGITQKQASQIQVLLRHLLAIQLDLKLTIESLNQMRFQPKKNYDTNQMEAGALQMLEGTNVICDETHMEKGELKEQGIRNVKALAELIEDQKVVYDFMYVQSDFPLSASVLVLSEGRSLFKNAIHVPGQASDTHHEMTDDKMAEILADQELTQQLRKYFLLLTHFSELTLSNYGVSKECSEYAQNHFVMQRKQEQENLGENEQIKTDQYTFHQWLVLSRLITISQGEQQMQIDDFKRAIELENLRNQRLK